MAVQQFTTQELESEEWRPVVGFEGYYSVSNLGRVMSTGGKWHRVGRVLKPSLNDGYLQVVLTREKASTTRKIQGLVAAAFLGKRPNGSDANHIDRNRANNRLGNLEYLTRRENILHSIINETHHHATLTARDARQIRRLDCEGLTPGEISDRFPHVDRKTIYNVRTWRTWKYLS